ncbi:hypothetical protein ACFLUT_02675, partial [Chloroflexota bacterium]
IKQEHKRLEEMGFSAGQIQVLYNDGGNVPGADGPIATEKSTKENIRKAFEKYAEEMEPSCTLALFVTNHGTGYNPGKGYRGERPALPDTTEYNQGKTYAENTFKIDVRKKVYRLNTWTNADGVTWRVRIDKQTNRLKLYERVDGKWRYRGRDVNNDGRINESETNQDIDGDGDKDNVGWNIADLDPWKHKNNEYDTDRDGTKDVKIRWDTDANKYVFERLEGTTWKKMGEDTNGDFIIDNTDGGVDWNLDGDKNDKVGFHEGINLWGRGTDSVLWDDEFVGMLKSLSDKGIHVVIHMAQCYGGGFVDNCEGVVDKIVTGAGEETIHWNRRGADGKFHAVDLEAFLSNLNGIDVESWDYAFDKGKVADEAAWTAAGGDAKWRNTFGKWELPVIPTDSVVSWVNGEYEFVLRLPEALEGQVHDFEIVYGLQKPRWSYGTFEDAPLNYGWEMIPGGFRVKTNEPIPLTPQLFKFTGAGGDQRVKVQLTDREHKPIGYIKPAPTDALPDREEVLDALLWEPEVDVGWVGDYCEGTLSVDFGGIDLSGGDAPLARVVLKANGIVWHDSGLLPEGTTTYDSTVTEDVLCGQRFILEVEATNVYGQVVRETREVAIAAPAKQQDWTPPPVTPPPYTPPPDGEPPPTHTILQAAVAVSGKSVQDGEVCTSTITISYDGTDLTGGDYPVTRVVLTVNGSVWHDSGSISQTQFHHVESRSAACGQTFNISVTVTNSIGRTATSSGSYTTPVP